MTALAATLAVQRQFHNSTYINAIIYNDPFSKKTFNCALSRKDT